MRKGKRKVQKLNHYENVFIFPGTIERLVDDGIRCVEHHQYEEAVQVFEEALQFDPEAEQFAFVFAVALYEMKDYQRSKKYAFLAMEHGIVDHLYALELYITNLIQLAEYEEVEMRTDKIVEDNALSQDELKKFIYLRDLNRRLTLRYKKEAVEEAEIPPPFSLESFKEKDLLAQQQTLAFLQGENLERAVPLLKEIAESTDVPPSIISFALTLLQGVHYNQKVTVQKFGHTKEVIPRQLVLPNENEKNDFVLQEIAERLEKDPSKHQFAESAIQKFMMTAFPFDWGDYSVEEIAETYILYIESLVSDKEEPRTQLFKLIEKVDQEPDF